MKKEYLLLIGYLTLVIGLFLYSFTQVDLSLTLSRASFWQGIQKSFQYIGYFNRPLATELYLILLAGFTVFYGLFLWLAIKGRLTRKTVWILILSVAGILTFSYNAFSHDIFNYIFDAKIVTYYQQNPYEHKALDFYTDPMLSFMHWTHRVYPYGPVWLALTVPLSFLGLQIFLLTFFLFKGFIALSFIGSCYFLEKIARKVDKKYALPILVFFAFSPLMIFDTLVSAHHDIVMVFLALLAVYLLLIGKHVRSIVYLLLSVGIKFATAFLFPGFLYVFFNQLRKKDTDWTKAFFLMTVGMIGAILLATQRTELQSWYLLWVIPFIALLFQCFWLSIPFTMLSLGLLLHYAFFLYHGNWDPPIPTMKLWFIGGSLLLGIITAIFLQVSIRKRDH